MSKIFQPWVHCSMEVDCISPPGSSKSNHRYDQAALSILAQKYGVKDLPSRKRLGVSMGTTAMQSSKCDSSVKLTLLTAASKHKDGLYVNVRDPVICVLCCPPLPPHPFPLSLISEI